MSLREPSCLLNHDVMRRELRDKKMPPQPCPECGWVLSAAREDRHSALDRLDLGALLDVLVEVSERLDNYVDTVDGDYGQPAPNWAMSLQARVDALTEQVEPAWKESRR